MGLSLGNPRLLSFIEKRARSRPDWNDFDNYWQRTVAEFYDARGVPRQESRRSAVYRVAQDISNRLAIAASMARAPDYRDELEEIIRTRYRTRREFCAATGLSEDMLSHVLSRRRHLSMESLMRVLDRIGFVLHIAPLQQSHYPSEESQHQPTGGTVP